MKQLPHLFVLVLFYIIPAQGLFEEAVEDKQKDSGQKKSFEIGGYIRGAFFGGKIPGEMKPETKSAYGDASLRLSAGNADFGQAFAEIRFNTGYESDTSFSRIELREAYTSLFAGPFDLFFGKQIIAWGRADAYNPTNVITPQRFYSRSANEDDRRQGNFLIKTQLTRNPFRFELLWIPVYAANELPINEEIISQSFSSLPVPVYIKSIIDEYPVASFRKSSFAVKINLEMAGCDGSISYFNGYNPQPGFDIRLYLTPEATLEVTPHFRAYRMHMIGADFSTTILSFLGLRGECAWRTFHKDFTKHIYIPNPDLQYVLGIDKKIKDFSFILQYYGICVFDFEVRRESFNPIDHELLKKNQMINRQTAQFGHNIVFRPALQLLYETLSLEMIGMYSINTKEFMLRPNISYQITDALSTTLGGEAYFGADESLWAYIREETNAVFFELKLSFLKRDTRVGTEKIEEIFGIELNVATAMLSSIMIGVGIDYTIHFLRRYREERQNHDPAREVQITLTTTGRGIIFNALTVIVWFSVMLFSNFMPIKFFGFLVVVSISVFLFGAMILIPAPCLIIRPKFLEPKNIAAPK